MSEQHELAIVFDGPPAPESGRFLEVELDGKGVKVGKWLEGAAGIWKLILPEPYAYLAVMKQALDLGIEALEQYGPPRDLDEGEERALSAMQEALALTAAQE